MYSILGQWCQSRGYAQNPDTKPDLMINSNPLRHHQVPGQRAFIRKDFNLTGIREKQKNCPPQKKHCNPLFTIRF